MKVGLIGLGKMGSGMAANLLKTGLEVTVYNRTSGKAQALALVAEACRGDVVITMLADDHALESVVFDHPGASGGGVIGSLAKGAVHVKLDWIVSYSFDRKRTL
jgi:3-hydroxyisobutyrate dehydrogenase-like beta-hydroxyacid dehydrogenase